MEVICIKNFIYQEMKVICIKNFIYQESTYIKNLEYELMEYLLLEFTPVKKEHFFYVSTPPKNGNGPFPAYPIDCKHRKNFITIKEYRKLKLEKIDEKSENN